MVKNKEIKWVLLNIGIFLEKTINMNLENIIEYAIYHDNLDKKISLPGIKKGMPIKSFFLENLNTI